MAMGTSACFADVITDKNLRRILGKGQSRLVNQLRKLIDKHCNADEDDEKKGEEEEVPRNSIDELTNYLSYGDTHDLSSLDHPDIPKITKTFKSIRDKVKDETGLAILVGWHDPDTGDSYDEIGGVFFHFATCELYRPTPKFNELKKKFGDVVDRCFYTEFG